MRKKNLTNFFSMSALWRAVVVVTAFLFTAPLCGQTIRYVKPVAEGDGSGSSWENASAGIQAMIDADGTEQVWIAEGTYNSENNGLIMKNNVALYGGFPATGTPVMDDRDWEVYTTILSGNDVTRVINNSFTEGAVLNDTAVLDGFTLSNGGQVADGGGMYNAYASPTVSNVIITDNTVFANGPGVYNLNSSPSFTNVTITDNSGIFGGGMYNSNSSPVLTDVEITDNTTMAFGAGMYNTAGSVLLLTNVIINDNEAQAPGGGVYNDGSTFTANGVTISGNTTTAVGGGMYNTGTSTLVLNNATINDNTANSPGGGIYIENSSLVINTATINNNTSNSANGGGIYITGGSLELTDATMDGNSASAPGGAICTVTSEATLFNVTLTNNTAGGPGGGIYNNATSLTFENGTVSNNAAVIGGGIYNDSDAEFTNIVVSGNAATGGPGGGIYNIDSAAIFTNVAVTGNTTTNPVGGGIYNSNAPATFTNVTIAGNSSANVGGGLLNSGSDIAVRNSIIYGNSSGVESDVAPTYEYSLVQGLTDTDNGNISGDTDPLFTDAPDFSTAPFTGGDYTPQATSVTINAGSFTYYEAGQTPDLSEITTDIAGNERVQSLSIDMGAYEVPCNTPLPEGDENQMVCAGAVLSDLVVTGTDLVWYDAETEGSVLELTTELTDGGIYYVSQTIDACESERKAVNVTIVTIDTTADLTGNTLSVAQEGAGYQWVDCNNDNQPIDGAIEQSYTATAVGEYAVVVTLNGCEDISDCITVSEILGVNDNKLQRDVVLYPNPATSLLNINTNANITAITVVDVLGKTVLSGNVSNNTVDVSALQPGVYVISLTSGENVYTRKFIKQ
ncbi:T9SS type A sorting domain-containing protein [Flavobacterium salilacus subsp. salilacus]|uniref:T9SS type A sorting domain-containing protein n=1 Tax=Flavobacterium TaxID=237 RepID=UPI001075832E|nr:MULTISPECIES: T9SS type A sorting domain-containing protein [Flavobacterium]KAF2519451.1 T9SS type A sorting domain-containing protein [Flavobacterium salilacus subsp. salilacus]MBE1614653.1 T9SS type A sorting domain-containing protein [Flavobacterium sp. SaA2.13]